MASFVTSALTAAFGIGGGVALLAILSLIMPVTTLIPLHGAVQMGSNAGRSWHFKSFINWPFWLTFAIGACLGTILGSHFIITLPDALLKLVLALFILFLIWGPKPTQIEGGKTAIVAGGTLSSLASIFVGATGPLVGAILAGRTDPDMSKRQSIVATHAACMTLQHGLKILAFGMIGFAFENWLGLLIAMIIAGYLGTLTGGAILKYIPDKLFKTHFKSLLTGIALFMLIKALLDFTSNYPM
ncbi:MAG: sulfite exporter TauE/SafE family protein [Cohaesibacter sp.]|nr:sulfite exporter TauE/SafE family protein [Cohaesibacter sp.]